MIDSVMAAPFLIIDGYNLMHAAGLAKRHYARGELEQCRRGLLDFLARHLSPAQRARATVVFDAGNAPAGAPREMSHAGLHVLFAERGGEADTVIEQLIERHSAPRQVLVVSGDRRLRRAARRRRAGIVDSAEFFCRLEDRGESGGASRSEVGRREPPHPKYSGNVSRTEIEYWLAEFESEADAPRTEPSPPAGICPEPKRPDPLDELAFWQARVGELDDDQHDTVDRDEDPAQNQM